VRTFTGFALGTLLSLGVVASAAAAGTAGVAPAIVPPAGIEVIVVTAKRPAAPIADEPIYEVIVTAKRPTQLNTNPAPLVAPVMAIDRPTLELAVSDTVIRL
jgi:hypothetical protein